MPTYGYFPGCSLKGTGAAYEESLLEVFRLLDLRLTEMRNWNCCGATSYMSIDEGSAFLLSAANLVQAHDQKHRELVAPCSACYLVLRKTQDYVERYPQIGSAVQSALGNGGLDAVGSVRVRHPLEVLYHDVGPQQMRARKVRDWTGGKVACYYGCQLVRPYAEADCDYNPTRMDELLRAAGIPTVEYSLKTQCCGGALTGTVHSVGVDLNRILLKEALRRGAQAIVTVCPLCQYNLDAYQREIRKQIGEPLDMPILYFTQVLGWTLGADASALALERSISGRKAIHEWFVEQPKEALV
jgi:heterodisulfide reductase subunit B